jgi:succinyl-CoA:acetate CoA-transferase
MHTERIRLNSLLDKVITAEEAALFIKNGMTIGMSGFTRGRRSQGGPAGFGPASCSRGVEDHLDDGSLSRQRFGQDPGPGGGTGSTSAFPV